MSPPNIPPTSHPTFETQSDFDLYVRIHYSYMDRAQSELMYGHWLQGKSLEEAAGLSGHDAWVAMIQREERQIRHTRALLDRVQQQLMQVRAVLDILENATTGGLRDEDLRTVQEGLGRLNVGDEGNGQDENMQDNWQVNNEQEDDEQKDNGQEDDVQ